MSESRSEVNHVFNNEFTLKDFITNYRENKKIILQISLILGILAAFVIYFIMDPIFLSISTVKISGKVIGLNLGMAGS